MTLGHQQIGLNSQGSSLFWELVSNTGIYCRPPHLSRNQLFIKLLNLQCEKLWVQLFHLISSLETQVILFKLLEGEMQVYQ